MKLVQYFGWGVLILTLAACSTVVTATDTVPPTTQASRATQASTTETPTTTALTTQTSTTLASTTQTPTITDSVTTETVATQSDGDQLVPLRFESRVDDVSSEALASEALEILNDPRGWVQAGFTFVSDQDATYVVVLAEGPVVDELCLPLDTFGRVSCQNGPVVALNADRWRSAVPHWDGDLGGYRGYLVNHEVGHLIGQRHPKPRCPVTGRPAGVMEQQTAGLEGCTGNAWPRDWEIAHAAMRPVVYAPLPDWGPDPVPANGES